jgi:hypothetical protein
VVASSVVAVGGAVVSDGAGSVEAVVVDEVVSVVDDWGTDEDEVGSEELVDASLVGVSLDVGAGVLGLVVLGSSARATTGVARSSRAAPNAMTPDRRAAVAPRAPVGWRRAGCVRAHLGLYRLMSGASSRARRRSGRTRGVQAEKRPARAQPDRRVPGQGAAVEIKRS